VSCLAVRLAGRPLPLVTKQQRDNGDAKGLRRHPPVTEGCRVVPQEMPHRRPQPSTLQRGGEEQKRKRSAPNAATQCPRNGSKGFEVVSAIGAQRGHSGQAATSAECYKQSSETAGRALMKYNLPQRRRFDHPSRSAACAFRAAISGLKTISRRALPRWCPRFFQRHPARRAAQSRGCPSARSR
jgi:hypothetical protein